MLSSHSHLITPEPKIEFSKQLVIFRVPTWLLLLAKRLPRLLRLLRVPRQQDLRHHLHFQFSISIDFQDILESWTCLFTLKSSPLAWMLSSRTLFRWFRRSGSPWSPAFNSFKTFVGILIMVMRLWHQCDVVYEVTKLLWWWEYVLHKFDWCGWYLVDRLRDLVPWQRAVPGYIKWPKRNVQFCKVMRPKIKNWRK